jgi:hypothetical protein
MCIHVTHTIYFLYIMYILILYIFFYTWFVCTFIGRNTLDGFYNCFGYITSANEKFLSQLTLDDKIISMKVVNGLENLKRPN